MHLAHAASSEEGFESIGTEARAPFRRERGVFFGHWIGVRRGMQ